MSNDPFIRVMFEQTGFETVVRESYYNRYPQNMRHLGEYKEEVPEVPKEVEPEKPKEPTRQQLMDEATIKGLTFSTKATLAELKDLLKE